MCLPWLLLLAAGLAPAQQRLNFLAVDNELRDAAGPYYFTEYGDSSNAFARAVPLAEAMGLDVSFESESKSLVFEDGNARATWDTTTDVAAGLRAQAGVLRVNGEPFPRAVPSGIVVDGVSYVPINPLAEAFGSESGWHPDARVVTVETPTSSPEDALAGGDAEPRELGMPRIGHHDGYTRVALDLPSELEAEVAVGAEAMALRIPGAALPTLDRTFDGAPLERMYSDPANGVASLVLVPAHDVSADGDGFRMGRTTNGTIYLDVGPDLRGAPAQEANVEPRGRPRQVNAAPAETERSLTVVIDAGHGGHDPGTTSPWAQEKEIVLAVTRKLRDRLEAQGIDTILTRDRDEFLSLEQRSTFATTERNVFVSVHANAASNRNARGIETWVFGQPLDPSHIDRAIRENGGGERGEQLTQVAAESAGIASDILSESQLNYSLNLAHAVQDRMVAATGARDRGVRQNLFYVIRTARIPAILVELGFVSHPEEGRRLVRESYQNDLADALADGIVEFLRDGGRVAQR